MIPVTVYPIGTEVTLHGGISARIVGIWLKSENIVQYQLVWWEGRTRQCEWVCPLEIREYQGQQNQQIGFKGV